MTKKEVPVLIVGGSLVGLTTALLLGHHGVPSLWSSATRARRSTRAPGTSSCARLEMLRQVGLEDDGARSVAAHVPRRPAASVAVESLAGRELATYVTELNEGVEGFSPTVGVFVNQDVLEPILRARRRARRAARNRTEAPALERTTTASPRRSATWRRGTRSRCAPATSSPPTATAARRGGSASRWRATASCRAASRSTSGPTVAPLLRDRNQGVTTSTTRSCAGSSGSTAAATGFLVINSVGPRT